MPGVAAAKRRLSSRAARMVAINHKRRRDSHRGYPDLHQTHRLPIATSLPAATHFPLPGEAVTFKFRVDRISASVTGTILTLGDQGSIGFAAGSLEVVTGGGTPDVLVGTFVGAPRDSAEVVVAIQPSTGQVRAWVDSVRVIADVVSTFPFNWATSGLVDYDGIVGADALSDLDVFVGQLPRHFGDVTAVVAPTVADLLFRAATIAQLATSRVPFMEKPD